MKELLQPEQKPVISDELKEQVKAIYEQKLCDKPDLEKIEILDEKEGLERLFAFLDNKTSFKDVQPFLLDTRDKNKKYQKDVVYPVYNFSFKQQAITLSISDEINRQTNGIFIAFPHQLRKSNALYYWLDIYTQKQLEEKAAQFPFKSARLKDTSKKIKVDFQRWHSIEERLLADYILCENEIKFDELVSFDIKVHIDNIQKRLIYQLGAYKKLTISIINDLITSQGDVLRVIPSQDKKKHYQWIDIHKIAKQQDGKELLEKVSSYQIMKETKSISSQHWQGYEKQLLKDYRKGKKIFTDLVPITFAFNVSRMQSIIKEDKKSIQLDIPLFINCKEGDNFSLTPKNSFQNSIMFENGLL